MAQREASEELARDAALDIGVAVEVGGGAGLRPAEAKLQTDEAAARPALPRLEGADRMAVFPEPDKDLPVVVVLSPAAKAMGPALLVDLAQIPAGDAAALVFEGVGSPRPVLSGPEGQEQVQSQRVELLQELSDAKPLDLDEVARGQPDVLVLRLGVPEDPRVARVDALVQLLGPALGAGVAGTDVPAPLELLPEGKELQLDRLDVHELPRLEEPGMLKVVCRDYRPQLGVEERDQGNAKLQRDVNQRNDVVDDHLPVAQNVVALLQENRAIRVRDRRPQDKEEKRNRRVDDAQSE
ncbi:hypothetical protein OIY81_3655 [Cryptosporidium canis]|uniref:Uncharacterized protein n=1 Tax=Cryptosporidium canis TaxID=195482 RepID=A0ABQ8P498_9CRYT|nr:hypothetical protein OIY81_3655 [Cryptosporidium canis]KAJ1607710.1 hypothetical protein OJ252_2767 [Cryptosporidium canis]